MQKSNYNVLEKKQIEKIMKELTDLKYKIGVKSRIEMSIQKDKKSKVSVYVSGFLSPVYISKTEMSLLDALFKVRKIVIRKMRKEAEKLNEYRQGAKIFGTDLVV